MGSVDSVIRTDDSSLLRQQLVIKGLENRFLRRQITAQKQEIEQLEARLKQYENPNTPPSKQGGAAKSPGRAKNLKKTTLAATLTPPATHRLDAAKVTREQLEQHQNPKRRFGSINDTVQTVSKSSRTLITTSHELLSMSRFPFQPPS
jgi:seryl-tRNA(Sec) selenium transferase